jgi:hypothetical protein
MVINLKYQKVCKQCGAVKPLREFHRTKFNKSGRMAKCKECHSFNCHIYYLENQQRCQDNSWAYYHNNKEKHIACCKRWMKKNKWFGSYAGHRQRAKEKGHKFDLTGQDVKELFAPPKNCAVTGKRLKHNKAKVGPDSPCMCRKDFKKGYTKKTVQLVSFSETMKRVGDYNKKRNR